MVAEPPSRLCIDKQSLILRAVGCRGKGREFPVAVQNDNIAFLNAIAAGTIQISSADVSVGFQEINIYINGTAHEGGQRKISYRFSIFEMMIRTFAVGSQVAGQIQSSVVIRNWAACVVTDQMAAAAFRSRIQNLC